jgi:alpha-tubulin suppressor-like RCC1 family protein
MYTTYPKPVILPAGVGDIRQIAAGYEHSLAIVGTTTDAPDNLLAWGDNRHGQLGNSKLFPEFLPVPVVGMNNVVMVSGGWNHSLACRGDATIWAWGDNTGGNLGNGTFNDSWTPVQVQGAVADVYGKSLAAGCFYSLAIGLKSP